MLNKELLLMGLKRDYGTLTVDVASDSARADVITVDGHVYTIRGIDKQSFPNNLVKQVTLDGRIAHLENMVQVADRRMEIIDVYQDALLVVWTN